MLFAYTHHTVSWLNSSVTLLVSKAPLNRTVKKAVFEWIGHSVLECKRQILLFCFQGGLKKVQSTRKFPAAHQKCYMGHSVHVDITQYIKKNHRLWIKYWGKLQKYLMHIRLVCTGCGCQKKAQNQGPKNNFNQWSWPSKWYNGKVMRFLAMHLHL